MDFSWSRIKFDVLGGYSDFLSNFFQNVRRIGLSNRAQDGCGSWTMPRPEEFEGLEPVWQNIKNYKLRIRIEKFKTAAKLTQRI